MRGDRGLTLQKVQVETTCSARCARALIAAGCLAMLTGCTPWREYFANGLKVGPNYCTPAADISSNWIDAADQRIHTDDPDLSHWWTVFNDGELNELIQASYNQNLTLKEAGFRILRSRAALAISVGYFFPQTQQAFGDWTRNSTSLLSANRSFLPQQFYDNWELGGFNMAWELDFWGRFRRAIEAAEDDLDASIFNYDDVLVTLLGDVASTYVDIRTIQQQLAYVRQNVIIQQESLDIAKARFQGGLTSDLDVEQATSQLAQTEALIPQFEIRLRQANDRLCVLLGIPTEDLTRLMGKAPIPTAPADVVIGIPAQLLTRRPDIRRAEREAAAQCARIGIAESNLYPRISVTGTVVYQAEHFNQLFNSESFQGAVGPGFQWQILNYGRLVNAVRYEDAFFKELVTHFRNVVLQANADVEDGLVEFLQSQVRTKSMQVSVEAAEKAVQLSIVQYRGGLVDFNRVALLEQNLVQQQDSYAQAKGEIALGLVRTYRALGGGWEIRCNPAGMMLAGEVSVDGEVKTDTTNPEELPLGKPTKPAQSQPPSKTPAESSPAKQPSTLPTPKTLPPLVPPNETLPKLDVAPGELIKPKDTPPRSAPTTLPDLGPDFVPNEDIFGPGTKSKPGATKPPLFERPNPPPADNIFGPPELPTEPPIEESKPGGAAKSGKQPTSKTQSPRSHSVRQASATSRPNGKPLFPGRVQHAGMLPEDRGEVRYVR